MSSLPLTDSWCETLTDLIKFNYMWTINNFSFRREERVVVLKSSTFSANDDETYKFCLNLYPNGGNGYANCLSVFLEYLGVENINAKFSISILIDKPSGSTYLTKTSKLCSFRKKEVQGFSDFAPLSKLYYLPNDTMKIICNISMVRANISHIYGKFKKPECKLSQDIANLFENAKLSDVTLEVGDNQIRAHKLILATRSTVFDAMFAHEMSESKLNRVSITDIDYEVVKEMLRFIYTGEVSNLNHQMAADLLIAANKYDLKDLKVLCEIELCGRISIETAADVLVFADLHDAKQLKDKTINFINYHIVDVFKTRGWQNLMATNMDLFTEAVGTTEN